MNKLLRLPAVLAKMGVSRSTIYNKMMNGMFPSPVKFGARISAWPENEISEIISAIVADKSNEEMADLVVDIESRRKVGGVK
jgi:prophage regulatory protein